MPERRAKFVYPLYLVRRAYVAYLWSRSGTLVILSAILLAWSPLGLKSANGAS